MDTFAPHRGKVGGTVFARDKAAAIGRIPSACTHLDTHRTCTFRMALNNRTMSKASQAYYKIEGLWRLRPERRGTKIRCGCG